jgi:hypothetical protein
MAVKSIWIRRRALALTVATLCVVALTGTALAGHITSGVKSYTGCLVPNDGVITKVKEGNAPKSACTGGQTQVHLSGGDITSVAPQAGGGLTGGGADGAVSLSLRRDCANGEIVKWNGSAWACAADSNSTYTAGTGLDLTGNEFSVEESYRLPQTCASGEAPTRNPASGGGAATWVCDQFAQAEQACTSGQFANGVTAIGTLSCAAPASSGGLQAFSTSTNGVVLAGRTSVLSKTLPPGKYVVFGSVELANRDLDSTSWGSCDLSHPGGTIYSTGTHIVDDIADYDSLSLTGAFEHGSGAVLLACTEVQANVDVETATLVAIKVDSIG